MQVVQCQPPAAPVPADGPSRRWELPGQRLKWQTGLLASNRAETKPGAPLQLASSWQLTPALKASPRAFALQKAATFIFPTHPTTTTHHNTRNAPPPAAQRSPKPPSPPARSPPTWRCTPTGRSQKRSLSVASCLRKDAGTGCSRDSTASGTARRSAIPT